MKKRSAPVQKFQGDNFVGGVGLFKTTFAVSAPPRQGGAAWKMTVDGVELARAPQHRAERRRDGITAGFLGEACLRAAPRQFDCL